MAGHRKATRSTLTRRSTLAAMLAVPAGIFTVVGTFATDSAAPVAPQSQPAHLLAESSITKSPADSTADSTAAEGGTVEPSDAATAAEPVAESAPEPQARPEALNADVRQGGIPDINYTAYRHAADLLTVQQPQCGIEWTLIAAIGRVESTHANHGAADADGNLHSPIYGPRLDGSRAGNAVIKDHDGGELDGDPDYDRAVGPTQFLPATWHAYAGDGNGDGVADPQNLYDAALTTGKYLCHGNLDLHSPVDTARAVLRYNNSQAYVNDVVGFASEYAAH